MHDDDFLIFHGLGTFDEAKWTLEGPGVRADAQCYLGHGSKNLLQRAILYRHKRNYDGREDCRPRPGETICRIWLVFLHYLWIYVFVWGRVLCGTRKHQSASVDCNGVIQKIHTRKIRLGQGLVHDEELWFSWFRNI